MALKEDTAPEAEHAQTPETTDIAPAPAVLEPAKPTGWSDLISVHPVAIIEPKASNPPDHGARDPGDSAGALNEVE